MSTRFWLASAGTFGVAAVVGLTLGSYAIRVPASEWHGASSTLATGVQDMDYGEAGTAGPVAVHCTGCGPTLAERERAKEMAGLDMDGMISGPSDPVVRDYMADVASPQPTVQPIAFRTSPPSAPMAEGLATTASAAQPLVGYVAHPGTASASTLPVVGAPAP